MSRWNLHSKKELINKKNQKCHDCGNPIFTGAGCKCYTYKNDTPEYKRLYICEDCMKYWNTREPKIEKD
jgi:hypothetical protein